MLLATIFSQNAYSLTKEDIKSSLTSHFDFKITESKINNSIKNGLWNSEKTFFISSLTHNNKIFIYAVTKDDHKTHFIDASYIANVMSEFKWAKVKASDKKEVIPVKIINCDLIRCLTHIRKRVWIAGQRYTRLKPLAIGFDGTIYKQ